MNTKEALGFFASEVEAIKEAGTFKDERIITTEQKSRIDTTKTSGVLNMCANNYLGLSNNKELIEAAKASYDKWGFGKAIFPAIAALSAGYLFLYFCRGTALVFVGSLLMMCGYLSGSAVFGALLRD